MIDAGTVTGLLRPFAVFSLSHDIAGLRFAVAALADTRSVFSVDEAVFFDAANGYLDNSVFVLADDRFLGDDVGDVVADRFADFLPMA